MIMCFVISNEVVKMMSIKKYLILNYNNFDNIEVLQFYHINTLSRKLNL